jgi:hypothetical protein
MAWFSHQTRPARSLLAVPLQALHPDPESRILDLPSAGLDRRGSLLAARNLHAGTLGRSVERRTCWGRGPWRSGGPWGRRGLLGLTAEEPRQEPKENPQKGYSNPDPLAETIHRAPSIAAILPRLGPRFLVTEDLWSQDTPPQQSSGSSITVVPETIGVSLPSNRRSSHRDRRRATISA